jgi:hypothetical protein
MNFSLIELVLFATNGVAATAWFALALSIKESQPFAEFFYGNMHLTKKAECVSILL